MRILFTLQEEKARGINFMLKSLVIAARANGHEVGLLVGYPSKTTSKNPTLHSKVEHVNLQRYLQGGVDSFRHLTPGGLRKRHVLKSALKGQIFKSEFLKINPSYIGDKSSLTASLDYVVKVPYFYQFLSRNFAGYSRWIFHKIVRKYKVDLLICISPTPVRARDIRPAKLIHFVHDAMQHELAEDVAENDTAIRSAGNFLSVAEGSDLILTNSKDTAAKVREVSPKASIQVMYGTASSLPAEVAETDILRDLELKKNGYLLFASTLEGRKNISNLLKAYAQVSNRVSDKLVLVGNHGYGFEEILRTYESLNDDAKDKILFTGYISETDKYTLYKNAKAFVFPSLYEGLGLVIIEAMLNDLPVVTTRRGALPEAGGRAAIYIEDPYDTAEIASQIRRITSDAKLRAKMIKLGRQQADKFTQAKFNARFKKALRALEA